MIAGDDLSPSRIASGDALIMNTQAIANEGCGKVRQPPIFIPNRYIYIA